MKRRKFIKSICLVIITSVVITSCQSSNRELIGKWQSYDDNGQEMSDTFVEFKVDGLMIASIPKSNVVIEMEYKVIGQEKLSFYSSKTNKTGFGTFRFDRRDLLLTLDENKIEVRFKKIS